MTDLLRQGIAAAKAGKRAEARALLMQVVEADERSEQGWLWLSGVVDDPADMRTCLHNVLDINPNSAQARQGLAWIEQRYGPPTQPNAAPQTAPQPAPAPQPERTAPAPAPSRRPALPDPLADPPAYTRTTANLEPVRPPTPSPVPAPPSSATLSAPPPVPAEPPATTFVPPPVQPIAAAPPENLCPYCGAPTTPLQQRCTQCRNDLMIRAAPREKRSIALTILGILWGIGGALALLGTALLGVLFFLSRRAPQAGAARSSDQILGMVAGSLLVGLLYIMVARGLLVRARWAYYVNIGLIALGAVGAICSALGGIAAIGLLVASLGRARNAAQMAGTFALIGLIVVGTVFVLLPIVLTVLSYGDFFGARVRFLPKVEDADHLDHYNSGIAYKNRGMWYMAAQEWEAAIGKKPREATYLHALGLAYAQLKKYYPQATPFHQGIRDFLLSRKSDLYAVAPELEHLDLL